MPTINVGRVRAVYKGAWDKTATYTILDRVIVDELVYEAIKDVPSGTEIDNTSYWLKLSVQGPQGERGLEGQQGPKGDTGEAPDAVLYNTQQTLTEAQQEQARANVGWSSAFTTSFTSAIGAWVTAQFDKLVEAYLTPILKELILENGGTQEEIDEIEKGGSNA